MTESTSEDYQATRKLLSRLKELAQSDSVSMHFFDNGMVEFVFSWNAPADVQIVRLTSDLIEDAKFSLDAVVLHRIWNRVNADT